MTPDSLNHIRAAHSACEFSGEVHLGEIDALEAHAHREALLAEVGRLRIEAEQAYANGYACGMAAATARTLEARPEDLPDLEPMF